MGETPGINAITHGQLGLRFVKVLSEYYRPQCSRSRLIRSTVPAPVASDVGYRSVEPERRLVGRRASKLHPILDVLPEIQWTVR